MRTSTLLTFLSVASAEQMVAEEEPRLLPALVSLLGPGPSADALQAPAAMRAPRPALRAGRPAMQFGFQNYKREEAEREGLGYLSPIAGPAKRDPDVPLKKFKKKDDAVATGVLPSLAVLGAPIGGGLAILLATLVADPALAPDSLPFDFLNGLYPPAIEKKIQVKAAVEKAEKAKKAAAEKEAAKKAEKEAEEAKAKAAEAAPKAKAR